MYKLSTTYAGDNLSSAQKIAITPNGNVLEVIANGLIVKSAIPDVVPQVIDFNPRTDEKAGAGDYGRTKDYVCEDVLNFN